MFTGITAELNPLHKGHESIIKYAKSLPNSEGVIAILSGNFTQRGSPAITDKFTRAYAAVMAGAEIVIELPFVWACSSGQEFSRGAVNILGRLGFVKGICFGMEDSNFDMGNVIHAMTYESESYREILRHEMNLGASYPKAVSLALEHIIPGSHDFIARPNNMLAVSYMTAAKTQGFTLKAYPYQRTGDYSSSAIRENLSGNYDMLPGYSIEILERAKRDGRLCDENKLWALLQGIFIRNGREDLRCIYGIDEGIEGLFLRHWQEANGLDDFIGRCVCARYTRAHIRRRLIYILLGLKRAEMLKAIAGEVPYARVIAFTVKGREILRKHAGDSLIPIITRLKDSHKYGGDYVADVERKASWLYELLMMKPDFKREGHKVLQFP